MVVDISQMTPFGGPVSTYSFGQFTIVLYGIGLALAAYFFVQEVTVASKKRSIVTEVLLSSTAAVFLGFGTIFLALWVGIYI
uniref:Dolichyl-diphosphooligosaccharide-protein glycosyltransferase subunit TMEM258 n=1 Tax=Panagrellus redivivus TaxID=6233 RepID=A0A7E4VTF6_PANRE